MKNPKNPRPAGSTVSVWIQRLWGLSSDEPVLRFWRFASDAWSSEPDPSSERKKTHTHTKSELMTPVETIKQTFTLSPFRHVLLSRCLLSRGAHPRPQNTPASSAGSEAGWRSGQRCSTRCVRRAWDQGWTPGAAGTPGWRRRCRTSPHAHSRICRWAGLPLSARDRWFCICSDFSVTGDWHSTHDLVWRG